MTAPATTYKAMLIATLGTLLEWAEYTFYGYMAIKLATLFFPQTNPNLSLLHTFGVFAIGYIMRPVGAIVFGHIGDRYGRRLALMSSIILMGIATLGIGLLPTYSQIGLWAPWTLLGLRMLQGIAVSGEYNGAAIFLIEQAPAHRACYAGAWIPAAAASGMVLGGFAAYLVSLPDIPLWAWRIPFLLGGISCLIGLYLRRHIAESPTFLRAKAQRALDPMPLMVVLKQYKRNLITISCIAAFTGIYVYIGNIYFVVFLKEQVGIATHHAVFYAMGGQALAALSIPVMGYWADYTQNPKQQYLNALLAIALISPLIFWLALKGTALSIGCAMMLYGLLNGYSSAPMMKLIYDALPTEIRYTGSSLAWSLSAAIFAGTAPMVAHFLIVDCQWRYGGSLYITVAATLAFWILSYQPNYADAKSTPFPMT